MLDTNTKKRIDDCRDILVGKLPDPKAQIEQITIGLIYKFMDDMDRESIELGGNARFFADTKVPDPEFPKDRNKDKLLEFSKYSWDKLTHPKVTAAEMLRLYSEAIESMEKNPNIPQLFRDIFNNAYLPYRDPETLKLFLKTIGEFEYTHSEKLGDAFEYLLSVMGSQGDAGQFRTPRHIIDFVVSIIDPDKDETIMDPACGTAGFLISAYKHILLKYTKANKEGLSIYEYNKLDPKPFNDLGDQLTPDARKKLIQNFIGYDISPDMVRLSLVNLYLHGFPDPHIHEYDTLSSEERWDETADVVLANPPFMSPKGGIRPHKRFSIQSNRSEVLFVDYIAEHLNPKGRAGIIVPEGVIFQSGTAYKDLRKVLVDNYLYGVVSLPSGVFNPYSGVKTSILLFGKEISKKADEILFVKIDNDGYNLGAQRAAVKGSQMEEAILSHAEFISHPELVSGSDLSAIAHFVPKLEIAKNGDYNLSGERYKTNIEINSEYKLVPISEVCESLFAGGDAPKEYSKTITNEYNVPIYSNGVGEKSLYGFTKKGRVEEDAVTISARGTIGYPMVRKAPFLPIVRLIVAIPNKSKVNINYLQLALDSIEIYRNGNSIPQLTVPMIKDEKIPLPPLSIQEEIVAEIEGHQKIIDGAKAVVANYKPKIDIDPDWEMVELGKYISTQTGGTPSKSNETYWSGNIPWVSPKDMKMDFIADAEDHISESAVKNSSTKIVPAKTLLVVVRSGILKHSLPLALTVKPVAFNQDIIAINPTSEVLLQEYLFYYLKSTSERHIQDGIKPGVTVQSFHNGYFRKLKIPVPTPETQRQIVAQIEKEQELVNANKQLIEIFEQKIKDRIAKVWGEETLSRQPVGEAGMQGEPGPEENVPLGMVAEPEETYQRKNG